MPFTLSHAAAVVPLARGPLVPAALVVGAMAPDVPYFVKVPRYAGAWYEPLVNATTTHHWPGALTVAVPTAAVLLVVWWVVRAPVVGLVVLTVWAVRAWARWRQEGGRVEVSRVGVVVLAGVAVLGLAAAGLAVSRGVAQGDSVEGVLVRLVTTSGAAVVAALVLYAVARRVSDRTVAASRVRAGSGRG